MLFDRSRSVTRGFALVRDLDVHLWVPYNYWHSKLISCALIWSSLQLWSWCSLLLFYAVMFIANDLVLQVVADSWLLSLKMNCKVVKSEIVFIILVTSMPRPRRTLQTIGDLAQVLLSTWRGNNATLKISELLSIHFSNDAIKADWSLATVNFHCFWMHPMCSRVARVETHINIFLVFISLFIVHAVLVDMNSMKVISLGLSRRAHEGKSCI